MQFRTDLAIEAREIAGENTGGIEFKKYSENGLEISRLIVKNQKARQALGKEIGTYITIELPSLTDMCLLEDSATWKSLPTHSDRKQADECLPPVT